MTADLAWLAELPGRCPRCYFHVATQSHRDGCPDGIAKGRKLRDKGMAATTTAHPIDAALVDAAIGRLCAAGREFSANTLRQMCPGAHPPVIGARIRAAATAKRVVRIGDTPSDLPGTHAHRIGVYRAASP